MTRDQVGRAFLVAVAVGIPAIFIITAILDAMGD